MDNLDELSKRAERVKVLVEAMNKLLKEMERDEIWYKHHRKYRLELNKELYNKIASTIKRELNKIPYLTLEDIKKFIEEVEKIQDLESEKDLLFSSFLSVAIDKTPKDEYEIISLDFKERHHYLLAWAVGMEAKINIAGDCLGCYAKRVKIIAGESGSYAGAHMEDSTLIVGTIKDKIPQGVGHGSIDSKIFIIGKSGNLFGRYSEGLEAIINEAGDGLASFSNGAMVFANKARHDAGEGMKNGELNVKYIVGHYLGNQSEGSIIKVDTVDGIGIGAFAEGITIYVREIKDINARSIDKTFFEHPGNTIFLGKETYDKIMQIPEYRPYIDSGQIRIWDERDYIRWHSNLETKLEKLEKYRYLYFK